MHLPTELTPVTVAGPRELPDGLVLARQMKGGRDKAIVDWNVEDLGAQALELGGSCEDVCETDSSGYIAGELILYLSA